MAEIYQKEADKLMNKKKKSSAPPFVPPNMPAKDVKTQVKIR